MGKLESGYQRDLRRKIEKMLPGCIVLKNDEQYLQGIPDITVMYGDSYALLEVKRSEREMLKPRANQSHYLKQVSEMGGFAAYVYPENEQEVLDALQHALEPRW